jgi:hypothetical protein
VHFSAQTKPSHYWDEMEEDTNNNWEWWSEQYFKNILQMGIYDGSYLEGNDLSDRTVRCAVQYQIGCMETEIHARL